MYETFFQLQRRPFSATPDPGCTYQAGSIQTVVDELVVCLERGEGIAVLTAPAGLGKTQLCEKMKQELGAGFVTILLRHANFSNQADLLRTLLAELGRSSPSASEHEARLQFVAALGELRDRGQLLVVICDEAHELTVPLLEELRQLSDHADHGVAWMRLLLSGQLGLEDILAGTELAALNQRLRSHVTLLSLTASEAADYIDYRITWAGGRTEEIFRPETLSAIIAAADGIPRCLNQLCDHVLLLAYVAEQKPAGPELVQEALADLQHLPLNWNVRAVREPQRASLQAPLADGPHSPEPGMAFGSHLNTWESAPTFSEARSDGAAAETEVWEFGAEPAEDVAEPAENKATPPDAFENFLQTVESEIERLEAMAAAESGGSEDVVEEPVVDRYAAIDAGWSTENFPSTEPSRLDEQIAKQTERQSVSVPVEYPPTTTRTAARPSITMSQDIDDYQPERQIQSDVLELVSTTRDGLNTRRIDMAQSQRSTPLVDESALDAVETPTPGISPERPFRNLFTRLRRKQKGLE